MRPISLTSPVGKLYERHQNSLLLQQVGSSLDERHFSSVKGLLTTCVLVDLVNFLLSSTNDPNDIVRLCFYDLSKGFDRVDHNILIDIMRQFDVHPGPEHCQFPDWALPKSLLWWNFIRVETCSCGYSTGQCPGPNVISTHGQLPRSSWTLVLEVHGWHHCWWNSPCRCRHRKFSSRKLQWYLPWSSWKEDAAKSHQMQGNANLLQEENTHYH